MIKKNKRKKEKREEEKTEAWLPAGDGKSISNSWRVRTRLLLLVSVASFLVGVAVSEFIKPRLVSVVSAGEKHEKIAGEHGGHKEKGKKDREKKHKGEKHKKKVYICPMHPEVRSHEPGRCPKCGMYLVPEGKEGEEHKHQKHKHEHESKTPHQHGEEVGGVGGKIQIQEEKAKDKMEHEVKHGKHKKEKKKQRAEKKKELYHCPMHPSYVSDRPGECPICGMNLVPVEQEEDEEELPPGAVKVSPWKQQLIGVRYDKVKYTFLEREIRTVGYIDYDERLVKSVSLKFSGWVEKLWVDYEGKFVRKGEPLFKIYSPDLASAQEDYIIALRTWENLPKDAPKSLREQVKSLLMSAREKLLLFDLEENQIKELERTKKTDPYMVILSPFTGFVIKKDVFEGQHITPDKEVFRIADISRLWILIDIYEEDIPFVRIGQKVKISTTFIPGKTFEGKVVYIYPYLNPDLRTQKVRVEVLNPNYELKPGMYATAYIKIPVGEKLVVPEDAVLFSGERAYVFVKGNSPGVLIPKEVKLGSKTRNFFVVEEGLSEGDEVVVSANFLIDSESKLKEALKSMAGHHH